MYEDARGKESVAEEAARPLSALGEGQSAQVCRLRAETGMRRRLQDIGLIEGTWIECVLKSPAGDPVAYRIRGALIALRRQDAEAVLVRL